MMSPREIQALENMGGVHVETVDGSHVTFSFASTSKMMVLIDALKADRRIAARLSVNSKRIDGVNFLTMGRK
jgi:hypothetical protein